MLQNFLSALSVFSNQAYLATNHIQSLNLILGIILVFFAYKNFRLISYFTVLTLYFFTQNLGAEFWTYYLAISLILLIKPIRRNLITRLIIVGIKKAGLLPKISETEKIALTSGNTWVDAELFSGKPDFNRILSEKYPKLTEKEQSFLDNEVEEVCKMCTDYEIQKLRDLPPKVWKYLSENKFFGIIIPKKYGGLEFSAFAHSSIVEKLASHSVPLAITVMVPNSLGPAELLLHYGTKEQQNKYLPNLAIGKDLPCFALTETNAGSDATSITSNGVLYKDKKGEIKIRLNWSKRYITLGAKATLIGVAFKLKDPDHLLFEHEDIGITCALVPNKTKGVKQGRRHDPLSTPFVNSPLDGVNVEISIDDVIGGKSGLGIGWKMLMDCLSAGRGISLPSTSSGGSKLATRVAATYSTIREQFGTSIAKFEGVEEVLARLISRTYGLDAMKRFTAGAVDSGYKPSVITAIAKYHSTELFRKNINDAMDIIGGRGIIRGPRNLLANAYFSTPISITVEGANIMTRSLIHFGQGAIMCHPYAYKEIEALEANDLKKFDAAFFSHINHLISNFTRSVILSVTRGYFRKPFKMGIIGRYERKVAWSSATFAFLADIALAKFGGNLKRKEKLNGRFGDVLSAMYFISSILRRIKANNFKSAEEARIAEFAIKEQLEIAQKAFEGIYTNLFTGFSKILIFPFIHFVRLNAFSCPSTDKDSHKIVSDFINNQKLKDSVTEGIYISKDSNNNLGRIENALKIYKKSKKIENKIRQAIKDGILPKNNIKDLIEISKQKSIISAAEMKELIESYKALKDAMEVDEYSLAEYKKI